MGAKRGSKIHTTLASRDMTCCQPLGKGMFQKKQSDCEGEVLDLADMAEISFVGRKLDLHLGSRNTDIQAQY